MRVRILRPCMGRLNLERGDELQVSRMTPELQALLDSRTFDGKPAVELVTDDEDEVAMLPEVSETATVRRGRSRRDSVA
jgi:hypothetical protein